METRGGGEETLFFPTNTLMGSPMGKGGVVVVVGGVYDAVVTLIPAQQGGPGFDPSLGLDRGASCPVTTC